MTIIKLGTRGSDLALWQTNDVAERLRRSNPDIQTEIVIISTKGDRILDTPLPLMGGKGLFTAELENALRNGQIDLAVHSLKDLPTENPAGLTIGAITERANPADVLISRDNYTLATLPEGATVGTSSYRRAAQLLHLRPDFVIKDIRGNIDTRILKAQDGIYDAIVLAHAGVARLNLESVISEILTFEQMLPAPGQGALAVQCRDDASMINLLAPIQHEATAQAVIAERAFLAGLGGGCSVPVAAYALKQTSGMYILKGRVCTVDGSVLIEIETHFEAAEAYQAGMTLASIAKDKGADRILSQTNDEG